MTPRVKSEAEKVADRREATDDKFVASHRRIQEEAAAHYRQFVIQTDRAKETDVERSHLRLCYPS